MFRPNSSCFIYFLQGPKWGWHRHGTYSNILAYWSGMRDLMLHVFHWFCSVNSFFESPTNADWGWLACSFGNHANLVIACSKSKLCLHSHVQAAKSWGSFSCQYCSLSLHILFNMHLPDFVYNIKGFGIYAVFVVLMVFPFLL